MMGDEADADWQDGLVEWGIEDTEIQLDALGLRRMGKRLRRDRRKLPPTAQSPQVTADE